MNSQKLNDLKALLEKYYIKAVVLEDLNPRRYIGNQTLIWAIASEIIGEEWADNMEARVRRNYREGKYDE